MLLPLNQNHRKKKKTNPSPAPTKTNAKPAEPQKNNNDIVPKEVKYYQSEFRKLGHQEALDQVVQNRNTCHFPTCKHSVTNLMQICDFCKEGYCQEHGNPFTHGCGDAFRERAQKQFREDAKKAQTGDQSKPLRPGQRLALQSKLNSKIEEQKSNRTKKPTEAQKAKPSRGRGK